MSNTLDFGVNGQLASKVGGTGTTIKYFPRLIGINGSSIGASGLGGVSGSSVAAPLFGTSPSTPSTTSAIGALFVPAANVYQGQQMDLVVSGNVGSDTGDPSGTANVQIQAVTGSLFAPTYTTIASTGANGLTFSSAEPFTFDITLVGDTTSGFLTGFYTSLIGATVKSPVILDNIIAGLNFGSGNASLQQGAVFGLVVGVTFGTSDASNKASLTQFTMEG
jgi:hypothetical protein